MYDLNTEVWSEERLLTLLGLTKAQLDRLVRSGELPVVRLGNSRAYLAESVYAWLKVRESTGKWEGRGRKPKS